MRYVSLLALCFVVVGCGGPPPPPETPKQKEVRLQEFGEYQLPTDARKIMDLGNGWNTFELEIGGVNRKFLYRKGSGVRWSRESITEISPAPLP